jgi:hypothetical protein
MVAAKIGTRVSADISVLRPELGSDIWAPGEIIGVTHELITVRVDKPLNGEDVFDVPPEQVKPLGW